jgi:seryl-tRNA synthetase
VLSPAACYPVYPLAASRGIVPPGGLLFDVASDCLRREPSKDLDRLQSFRMREYVCIGATAEVARFRETWIARAGRSPISSACRIASSRRVTRSLAAAES